MLRVYGVFPWHLDRFTFGELRALDRDLRDLAAAAKKAGKR